MGEAFEKFKAPGEREGEARGKREAMIALKDIAAFPVSRRPKQRSFRHRRYR